MTTQLILPISSPPITCLQFYALPLSIICTDKMAINWLYGEFIQLHTFRKSDRVFIHFYGCENEASYEPLDSIRIRHKLYGCGEDIIDGYKTFLNKGQYIYDIVNIQYIKCFNISNRFVHDVLVYGYNDDKKTFNVFAYKGLKLTEFEVSYDEYIQACNSSQNNSAVIYRLKNNEFDIDIKKIKWYLLDYIEGVNTYDREKLHTKPIFHYPKFGINIYDELIYMFNLHYNYKLEFKYSHLYCFYEHKKLMTQRVEYLNNNSDIKHTDKLLFDFKVIEENALKIINISMKMQQKNFAAKSDLERILSYIKDIGEKEKYVYNEYFNYNKNIFDN